MSMTSLIVVADASVLINFLKLDRMDLIARHPSKFLITNHVSDEVIRRYAEQWNRLKTALDNGILEEHPVTDLEDLNMFGRLCQDVGNGEASAIAFALPRGYALAVDDKKAIRIAARISAALRVIRTQDLFLVLIQEGLIDVQEADDLKSELETKHRFKMPFRSFRDLI